MDRIIKFRVWDGEQMYYPKGDFYVMRFDGVVGKFDYEKRVYNTIDNPVVMQFTGLWDKKGTEIYESDIIKTNTDKLMVVGWSSRFASFVIYREDWVFQHWFGEAFEGNECEVVGNIYEHTKLINQ